MTALDLVGFGEAMVLITPSAGTLETVDSVGLHVAGAELNVCAAAASLGLATGFASRVGADPFGQRVLAAARRLAVDASLVTIDDQHPTGVFFKDVHPDGRRRVYYYRTASAAAAMDRDDADRLVAARPRLVVVSGITAALSPDTFAAVRHLTDTAHTAGIRVALDPNLRPALGDPHTQAKALLGLLPRVDVLLLGTDEAGPLLGTDSPADVFAAAQRAGVAETVLKAGADGAYVQTEGKLVHLPTFARTVVDPVGAGDAFAGGYLAARMNGLTPWRSAWLGSKLAALVMATPGDTEGLPSPTEGADLLTHARAAAPH